MSSATLPEMILHAGEVNTWTLDILQSDGTAMDLSGCTVYFTAKKTEQDADSDAYILIEQASHTDAANGETTIDIDLSGVGDRIKIFGDVWIADLWVKDSADNIIPQGLIKVTVKTAVRRSFS